MCDLKFVFPFCSGLHLAVIHNKLEILDWLLSIVSRDLRVKLAVDDQNGLYQVRTCKMCTCSHMLREI